jgi:hypothetical protein
MLLLKINFDISGEEPSVSTGGANFFTINNHSLLLAGIIR